MGGEAWWVLGGLLLSVGQTVSLVLFVGRLRPSNTDGIWRRLLPGYVLRYAAAGLLLLLALQQGVAEGLMAFVGLWLGRWVAVCLGQSGRIDWSVFD